MTESFTIGDSMKYSCVHEGKNLIIGEWELFDKDWGILKEKATKWDHVVAQSSKDFVHVTETLRKLEAVKKIVERWDSGATPFMNDEYSTPSNNASSLAMDQVQKEILEGEG